MGLINTLWRNQKDGAVSHSLHVQYVIDVLSVARRLSQGNVDGLLQAAHGLVDEAIIFCFALRNVDVRHDSVDVQTNLLPILGAAEHPDHRHLFDVGPTELGHTRIQALHLGIARR